MSPTWIMPSMPSPRSTKAPNFGRLVTGASTTVPTGYFFCDIFPGIAERLLEAERDALVGGVDAEDDRLPPLRRL